ALSKIVHLKNNNYLGYSFETTASFMAVGLQFHLLSRSSWTKTDPNVEYTNFLENMFPGYEEEITLIYQNLPYLNRQNFGSALESLREIKQKSLKRGETSITSRVDDLE